MTANFTQVDKSRLDELLVNASAILMLRNVAFRLAELFDKEALTLDAEDLLGQLRGTAGILDHLHGFNPRELVEEPAATGVHQHGVALELHQLPDGDSFRFAQRPHRMLGRETLPAFRRPVQNDVDVIVARRPGVLQERPRFLLEERSQRVPQPVQGLAQRGAPFLVPVRVAAGIAAAIAAPPLNAVDATPGAVLEYFHLVSRGVPFE